MKCEQCEESSTKRNQEGWYKISRFGRGRKRELYFCCSTCITTHFNDEEDYGQWEDD